MADPKRNPQDVVYEDQKWPDDGPVPGEQLSVNGRYAGQKVGTPTQDAAAEADANTNADPYWVEHATERYGTITQDKQMIDDGTFPKVKTDEAGEGG